MATSTIDPGVLQTLLDKDVYVCPTVSGILRRIPDRFDEQAIQCLLGRLAAMRTAGVRLIAGTDSGFGRLEVGVENRMDDYVSGLEIFAAAGWDQSAVIEAATVLAAEAIGVGGTTGALDVGKQADILAVRGNPLHRLDDLRRVEMVLVSGRNVTQTLVDTVASSGGID